MNRRLVGAGLVLGIATALATACSATSPSGADSAAVAPYQAESAGGSGGSQSADQGEKPAADQDKKAVTQPGVDRMLVRTATVELSSADPTRTVDRARDVAASQGGYTGSEDVQQRTATVTLHIPSDRFDRALNALSALGKVISRQQSADDVTEQVVDLDSRITTQRASVDRIRALLAKAGTVDEIVSIEAQLTSREADLESLQQRSQALAGQVAMSTVTIRVSKTNAPPPPAPQEEQGGFLTGLSDGWHAFLGAGAATLRVVGAVLPFVLVLAIPGVPAYRWWRRRRAAVPLAEQPSTT
jgi:hypothetical protein